MPPTRTATARRTLHAPSQGASTPGRTRLHVRRARLARPADEDRSSTPRRVSVPRSAAAAHMHDLCALEAQRMQAKQEQERFTQEERLQRARTVDEQLMEERRVAKENRPPPSSWHTYQDYEMKLLCAEYEQTVSQLRAELEDRDTELARLRLAADQHHQAESQLTTCTSGKCASRNWKNSFTHTMIVRMSYEGKLMKLVHLYVISRCV